MKLLFEEKQRYTQWWLWLIIISTAAMVIGMFVYAMYFQLVLGNPWGDNPMSNDALIANSLFIITAMVVMLLIFFNSVLEVVVDRTSVSYRYFPLIRKWRRIERETIQGFEKKTYYLKGYGIKRDLRGNRAVNVKGNIGVEITMLDGKRLLIGTQKAEEFMDALNKMKKRSAD
jgi:hypothetical protein